MSKIGEFFDMNNPFKNNSLASGLMGFILGGATIGGGMKLSDILSQGIGQTNTTVPPSSLYVPQEEKENKPIEIPHKILHFHGLHDNPDGDVVITTSGSRYHSLYGCRHVKDKPYIKVDRHDAESVGLSTCSRCSP